MEFLIFDFLFDFEIISLNVFKGFKGLDGNYFSG